MYGAVPQEKGGFGRRKTLGDAARVVSSPQPMEKSIPESENSETNYSDSRDLLESS